MDGQDVRFRAHNQLSLLGPLAKLLPDAAMLVINNHDLGTRFYRDDQRESLESLIESGQYASLEELRSTEQPGRFPLKGIAVRIALCAPGVQILSSNSSVRMSH